MSTARGVAGVLTLLLLVGCDTRVIDATAALPALGTPLPAFTVASYRGDDSVRSTTLTGAPTLLVLWSTHCPFQVASVAMLDSLARTYVPRGARVVVLADDAPGRVLDSVLSRAVWAPAVTAIGVAAGTLRTRFDQSRTAPERATARVEFVLPSFLLLGADGRVLRRAFGPTTNFRPTLDSLLAVPASPRGRAAL